MNRFNKIALVFSWLVFFPNNCLAQDFSAYITINESEMKYPNFNSIYFLKNLVTKISIFGYDLSHSFDTLYQFKNIHELNIMACDYNFIPDGICKLSQLEILNLDYTDITSFPSDLRYLKKIKELRINKHDCFGISDCAFQIPNWINDLTNLESIDFKDCELTEIPENFYLLKKLKSIFIIHSNLKKFPIKLNNIKSLESIVYIYGGGTCPPNSNSTLKRFECQD